MVFGHITRMFKRIANKKKATELDDKIKALEKIKAHSAGAIAEVNAKRAADLARGPIGQSREMAYDQAKNRHGGPTMLRDSANTEIAKLRAERDKLRNP